MYCFDNIIVYLFNSYEYYYIKYNYNIILFYLFFIRTIEYLETEHNSYSYIIKKKKNL